MTYLYHVRWKEKHGTTIATHYGATLQEAHDKAFELARDMGYTVPRWWQFWRWGDSRPLNK